MTPLEKLVLARAVIENIDHWCQHSFARDENGDKDYPDSKFACQYCAAGACIVAGASASPIQSEVPDPFGSIQELNDHYCRETSHRRVLEVFDAAIGRMLR